MAGGVLLRASDGESRSVSSDLEPGMQSARRAAAGERFGKHSLDTKQRQGPAWCDQALFF
jgi:hypothetical protein